MIAEKWDISRDDMEAFAVESHERALRASAEGRFEREIVPLAGVTATRARASPTSTRSARCRTLVEGGRLTAAVSSQISDASAALLIASEQAVNDARPDAARRASTTCRCAAPTRCGCSPRRSRRPRTRSRRPA